MKPAELIEEKVERFEHNLRAQAELYRTLLGLARRQAEEISAENMDGFVLFLEEKKKIVEEIGDIEASAAPLRLFWEEHKGHVGEQTRVKLRAVVNEIRGLLEELLELESSSQRKLGITKDSLEEQIRQVSTGPRAMRSYTQGPDCKPRFMDERG
jgi:hypothetical protein